MTSSLGWQSAWKTLKSACFVPQVMMVWAGWYEVPRVRFAAAAAAERSSGMPATGVYFVWLSRMAWIAACLMGSGVWKSGSPAVKSSTGLPALASALALAGRGGGGGGGAGGGGGGGE